MYNNKIKIIKLQQYTINCNTNHVKLSGKTTNTKSMIMHNYKVKKSQDTM